MSKAERERSARDRIKEQQAAERARDRRRRLLTYLAVGALAILAIGGGYLYSVSRTSTKEVAAEKLAPITISADGSAVMAQAGVDKPVLDVYEDFQCPACREYEQVTGQTIKNLASEGKVKVVYHPITIFTGEPTRGNSLRAAAAIRGVTDGAQWMAFHDKLYAEQPPESVEGFKLDDLVKWGKEVGVTAPGFAESVTSQKHAQEHVAYSEKILKTAGIQGTPTLKLNGVILENDQMTPEGLRRAVLDAAK